MERDPLGEIRKKQKIVAPIGACFSVVLLLGIGLVVYGHTQLSAAEESRECKCQSVERKNSGTKTSYGMRCHIRVDTRRPGGEWEGEEAIYHETRVGNKTADAGVVADGTGCSCGNTTITFPCVYKNGGAYQNKELANLRPKLLLGVAYGMVGVSLIAVPVLGYLFRMLVRDGRRLASHSHPQQAIDLDSFTPPAPQAQAPPQHRVGTFADAEGAKPPRPNPDSPPDSPLGSPGWSE